MARYCTESFTSSRLGGYLGTVLRTTVGKAPGACNLLLQLVDLGHVWTWGQKASQGQNHSRPTPAHACVRPNSSSFKIVSRLSLACLGKSTLCFALEMNGLACLLRYGYSSLNSIDTTRTCWWLGQSENRRRVCGSSESASLLAHKTDSS